LICSSVASDGKVNEKVLPCPGVLWTQTRPPCCSTMLRQMASPRPLPPLSRASEESTCWKRPKTASSLSGGMLNTLASSRLDSSQDLAGVNFQASSGGQFSRAVDTSVEVP
jgi:hypothetical protein